MLEGWFLWFILFWVIILLGSFAIGGFFMFRKFLKKMPKVDGMSDMDWDRLGFHRNPATGSFTKYQQQLTRKLLGLA
jgi:hypothetical protein